MNNKLLSILIIEEDERFASLYEKILCNEGFTTTIIRSKEQLENINNLDPDVVIVDIFSFGLNKMEIFRNIKDLYPKKPFIIISSLTSIDDCIHGYEMGAKRYVQKSVNLFPFVNSVKEVTNSLVLI